MLAVLARRRSLVLVIALAVSLAAFSVPAVAGDQGHCLGAADQHCPPALLRVTPLPAPSPLGFAEPRDATLSLPAIVVLILKVPLTA